MNKPSEKQLDAVIRLLNEDSFRIFVAWINESFITMATTSLGIEKEPQRSWYQGRAQELQTLSETIRTAREQLQAMHKEE